MSFLRNFYIIFKYYTSNMWNVLTKAHKYLLHSDTQKINIKLVLANPASMLSTVSLIYQRNAKKSL